MYYIGILFWVVGVSVTWGADSSLSSATAKTDLSMHYLAQIFGIMEGVLHGSGSQILGNLSKAFNSILLIIVGGVWAYTAFVGILNTASDGQFLGQRGASIWLPLRLVIGMCALVPKATTGYSIIQVLVMYFVIQGVNFANFIHNTTLQYLERGGTVIESYATSQGDLRSKKQYQNLVRTVGSLLKSEVKMIVLYKGLLAQKASSHLETLPNFSYMLRPREANTNSSYMRFPNIASDYYGQLKDLDGICGELVWENTPLMNASVQLMIMNLLPIAEQIANEMIMKQSTLKPVPVDTKSQKNVPTAPDISIRITKIPLDSEKSLLDMLEGRLVYITDDFIALAKSEWRYQAMEKEIAIKKELKELGASIEQGGWITAGSYYYQLAQYNQKVNQFNRDFNLYHNRLKIGDVPDQALQNVLKDLSQYENLQNCLKRINHYIDKEIHYAARLASTRAPTKGIDSSRENSAELYYRDSLLKPLTKNITLFQEHLNSTLHSQIDPITSLSNMGQSLMGSVESIWKELIKPNEEISIWREIFGQYGLDPQNIKTAALMPLILIWMTLNFTIGATLTYYIPLIPFLFYFFGSLTWLIQVMEVVFIGAPLACLGLAHPEGQGFYGKAGQAIMLITHVVLRPVLMVLGLIAGMILSTIAFSLFNAGYLVAIKMIDPLNGELLGIVSHTAMMMIYTTASYSIVSRTFAMINDLPNKALRSMEGLTEGNNEAEPAMQVKSNIDQYAGNVSGQIVRPASIQR